MKRCVPHRTDTLLGSYLFEPTCLFVECGPAFFTRMRPHSMGETCFLLLLLENHLKKTVWSRHLFLFYFKGEKQNKKEKP